MTNSSVWSGTTGSLQPDVYTGAWVNWSRGRIMGATLTLDRLYGNLLIAFTATFVGLVATAAWRISCLCFHRVYSSPNPRDALHHQRQAILRNSPSAASGFWMISKLAWTWCHDMRYHDLLARILPVLVLSGLCFCFFTVAAGLSSTISSGVGTEVLLNGHDCGMLYTGTGTPEIISAQNDFISQTINNAVNYAHECYSSNATGNFDCTTFIKDHLPGTMDDEAGCPFQGNMCRSNESNLFLDSGYLDSHEHFGLNMPNNQRILFRTTMHCAPINTEGFSKNVSTLASNYTQYDYGPYLGKWNFTFQTEDLYSQYLQTVNEDPVLKGKEIRLSSFSATTANKTVQDKFSDFVPDRRLFRSDADLYIIFLSGNGAYFLEQTTDPWYRGSVPWLEAKQSANNVTSEWSKTIYRPEEAASPMGCIQQYQYCNAERKCGELASFYDANESAAPLLGSPLDEFNGHVNASGRASSQFIWFERIIYNGYDLASILGTIGISALASRSNYAYGSFGWIPDDQWKSDVKLWWAALLAAKQSAFVSAARGPRNPLLLQSVDYPENEYMRQLCENQKLRSTKYTSFSLFGLYFTFIIGVLIMLVSYLLEPLFQYLGRKHKYEEFKFIEWSGNETLQLQRMAYQGLGSEAWSGYTDSIPKTRPGYFLADLHVQHTVEQSEEVGPAETKSAQIATTKVPRSQVLFTGTDDVGSSTDLRASLASDDMVLPDVVSPTAVSHLEISPTLMPSQLGPGESISPISQASQSELSEVVVESVRDTRL